MIEMASVLSDLALAPNQQKLHEKYNGNVGNVFAPYIMACKLLLLTISMLHLHIACFFLAGCVV